MNAILAIGALLASVVPAAAEKKPRADLKHLVVIGDSLSAGFQNFSLFDSPVAGQAFGYAAQVAKQANVDLRLPLISYPGIPATLTIDNNLVISRGSAIGQREKPHPQADNLSVPGFSLLDILAHAYPGTPQSNVIDAMSDAIHTPNANQGCAPIAAESLPFLLPGVTGSVVSQVLCAITLKPTAVLVSAGNNDALQALTVGIPPTPPDVFAAEYAILMQTLAGTGANIVVSNIPDVTILPFLTPVPVARAICQKQHPLPDSLSDQDFLVPDITNPQRTVFDLCTAYAVRPLALVAQAQTAVSAYNAIIDAQAAQFGAVVVDVNKKLNDIAAHGYPVGGKILTTRPLGGLFSLDLIHPTNVGYAILAQEVVNRINTQLDISIPPITPQQIEQVAATDPLFTLVPSLP